MPNGNPPPGGGADDSIIRSSYLLLGDGPAGRPVNCWTLLDFRALECVVMHPMLGIMRSVNSQCGLPAAAALREACTDPGPPPCPSVMETLSWNQPATRLPATAPGHDATSRSMPQPLLLAGWALRSGVDYYEEKLTVLSLCHCPHFLHGPVTSSHSRDLN